MKDKKARAVIRVRLYQIILGNLGDCKPVGEGVSGLRVDSGQKYRIYFGQDGTTLIILLYAGSKKSQKKILTWPNCFGLIIAGEKMNTLTKNYKDDFIKDLRNPKKAAEYLKAALQDGNQEIFLMALRDVAAARGI